MTLAYPMDDARAAAPSPALTDVIDRLGVTMRFGRDEEIYAQDDAVEFLYRVVSGTVRTSRLTSDGRRQVGDFYYPGDLFGLETGPEHRLCAEALSDCEGRMVRRTSVRAFSGDAELDRAILAATHRELERMQEHLLLLGCRNAQEKVARFLFGFAQRVETETVDLPMGRQDMADYLGLTIETVSRMLTQLQEAEVVQFAATRRFRVTDWDSLERFAE
jgi:CRP/FNR family nitrogen fixation transcriptional regulator